MSDPTLTDTSTDDPANSPSATTPGDAAASRRVAEAHHTTAEIAPTASASSARTGDERHWHRFVAIGDSFTEGMSDPDPRTEDAYLGWADRLAVALAEENQRRSGHDQAGSDTSRVGDDVSAGGGFAYANLAIRGKLLDDVIGPQLDAALAMQPDLVSMVGGGNDILRPSVDLDDVADKLDAAVARIKDAGADVLLATMVNPTNSKLMARLRPRISWHIANLWGIAQRHDCYVVDLWGMRALRDERMWGVDRLHLSPEGHRRVAQQAAWTLGLPTEGDWLERLPDLPPKPARERLAANAQWSKEYFGPWIERRVRGTSSGDGREAKRPELTPIDLSAAVAILRQR